MSLYSVNDKIRIAILFDDKPYFLEKGNTLTFLHMAFSTKYLVPTLSFALTDTTNMMDEMKISDGTIIKIIINTDKTQKVREFKLFNWTNPKLQKTWTFDAYWNKPKYFLDSINKPFTGTSSSVIKDIVTQCGWEAKNINIDFTSDHQTWYPGNKTYAQFVKQIAESSYKNEEAYMLPCIDSTGIFKFQDSRSPKTTYDVSSGYLSNQSVQCLDANFKIVSNFNNPTDKYKKTLQPQALNCAANNKAIESLTFLPKEKRVLVNEATRSILQTGSIKFGPICVGNMHPNAQKAKYNNSRFDSLKSVEGTFIFDHVTGIEPLDGITYSNPRTSDDQYSGQYVVSHGVVYIQASKYFEKYISYREGLAR